MLTTLELPHCRRSTRTAPRHYQGVSISLYNHGIHSFYHPCESILARSSRNAAELTVAYRRPTPHCPVTLVMATRHMGCNSSKQFVEFEKVAGDIQPENPRKPKRRFMGRWRSKKATTAPMRSETPPPWVRNDHHVFVADPQNVNGGYTVSRDVYYSTQKRPLS